ncbi:hypothetical protein [Streptomyces sp. NPDC048428]|uniref:hypothetical protein n=1 Tax=Streptomyces sp. NPDC048428 TaxID=3154503 RepID=UPI003440063D
MADQEFGVVDTPDDVDRKHTELKNQIRRFLGELKDRGLSQNQFELKYDLGKGKVSNVHRPGAYGPHFPNLKMINALCTELEERCDVQDSVLDVFRGMYRDTLEAICARKDPAPHNTHVLMLTVLNLSERIVVITRDAGNAHAEIVQLTAERESLRDSRDDERRRRIEELSQQRSAWLAEKQSLLSQRDRVSDELAKLDIGQEVSLPETASDLGASHAQQQPYDVATSKQPQLPPPAKVPVPLIYKGFAAAFCLTVAGFAVYGVVHALGGDDSQAGDDAKGSGKATLSATAPSQPSADPGPAKSSATPTPTAKPKPKPKNSPYPNEPLPLVLTVPPCSDVAEIDFDRIPFSKWIDTSDLIDEYNPADGTDMTWSGCSSQSWSTMSDAHAGIVRKGTTLTEASCKAAAYGGGLESYRMWDGNPGFEKGASLCVLTDRGRLIAAKVVDFTTADYSFTFDVITLA